MTRATLLHVLERPTALGPVEVRELEQLAQAFPYCQTAHLLLAKAAHDHGTMLAGQRLRRAATYAADRTLLRRLIEQQEPIEQPAAPEPAPLLPPPHPLDLVDWPDEYVPPAAAPPTGPARFVAAAPAPAPAAAQPFIAEIAPPVPLPAPAAAPAVAEVPAPVPVLAEPPVAAELPPAVAPATPASEPISAPAMPELPLTVAESPGAMTPAPAPIPAAEVAANKDVTSDVASEPQLIILPASTDFSEIGNNESVTVAGRVNVPPVVPVEAIIETPAAAINTAEAPVAVAAPATVVAASAPVSVDMRPPAVASAAPVVEAQPLSVVPEAAIELAASAAPATGTAARPDDELPAQAPAIRPPVEVGEARFEFGLAEPAPGPAARGYELPGLVDEWAASAVTRGMGGSGASVSAVAAVAAAPAAPVFTPAAFTGDAVVGYALGESSRLGLSMQLLDLLAARAEAAETATAVVAAAQPAAVPLPPTGTFFEPDALLLSHWATHQPAPLELPSTGDLINNFLKRQPRLTRPAMLPPAAGGQADLSVRSTRAEPDLVSENLARIFVRQGKTARAIEIYEKLMVKQPEKMAYFALQIQSLQPSA